MPLGGSVTSETIGNPKATKQYATAEDLRTTATTAAAGLTLAANARQMVLNDRDANATRFSNLQDVADKFDAEIASADTEHLRLQDEINAISRTPGPIGPAGPPGAAGLQGERGAVGATGPQGSVGPKGETGATGVAGPVGATGPQGAKGDAGTPADMGRVTALEATARATTEALAALTTRVGNLEKIKTLVSMGTAQVPATLLRGDTNVVVALRPAMPDTGYVLGGPVLSASSSLLGSLSVVGEVASARTKDSVTITVRNGGLGSLLGISGASVSVVAARDVSA
jgi:hypothetical protein